MLKGLRQIRVNNNIMKVEILFDKKNIDKNLKIGWGISFLIDDQILFDTGENSSWLIHNIEMLNVDIKIIWIMKHVEFLQYVPRQTKPNRYLNSTSCED